MRFQLVVMGASWGGLYAVGQILRALPPTFAPPLVIVQHREQAVTERLIALWQRKTPLRVITAQMGLRLQSGTVYVAPPKQHLLIKDATCILTDTPAVHYARPAIDPLFASAAAAYGASLLGVLLTGANADGANGLARIDACGGLTIVQDPATAARREMPMAALAYMHPTVVVPLAELGSLLVQLCQL